MIIWITGGSTGLGREVARQYAQAGHTVCASARGAEALTSLVGECQGLPGKIHAYPLDVTDVDRVAETFASIQADVGLPELVILNAGTSVPDKVQAFDRENYQRIMNINYMGVINCLAPVVPEFIARSSGQIAIVASVAGYRGLPLAAAYCASKSALITLSESLQPELAVEGINLQVVNPGFVRTPLTEKNEFSMPFLMEVEAAAASMIGGLAQGRFEVTFPKRFTWLVKFTQFLPNSVFLRLTRNLVTRA
jgi:short-subunit dehydrogenase